jgi:hypothetical protein
MAQLLTLSRHRITLQMIHAQRQAVDPIGWCAEAFEWASTYILSKKKLFLFSHSTDTDAFSLLRSLAPGRRALIYPFLRHK